MSDEKESTSSAGSAQVESVVRLLEKIKYWHWKWWYLASFPFRSPTRFIGELRIFTVYDPAFRNGGLAEVKRLHAEHLNFLRNKFDEA